MVEAKKEKVSFKERKRKFIVSLKKRPHNIALVMMGLTFIIYSFNLTKISDTTATINKTPMGFCEFVTMLFSILAFVAFLNAFPKRQKPVTAMVIVLYVMLLACIVCDAIYFMKIQEGLAALKKVPDSVSTAQILIIVHIVMLALTVVLTALIPVIGKAINKIDTSIDLHENSDIDKIELSSDN